MVNKVGPRICHVYAQPEWHADAKIVGTFEAFRILRDALHDVMYDNPRERVGLFTQDGEGYDLVLELDNSDWQSESWKSRPVPYTRDYARGDAPTREERLELAARELEETRVALRAAGHAASALYGKDADEYTSGLGHAVQRRIDRWVAELSALQDGITRSLRYMPDAAQQAEDADATRGKRRCER